MVAAEWIRASIWPPRRRGEPDRMRTVVIVPPPTRGLWLNGCRARGLVEHVLFGRRSGRDFPSHFHGPRSGSLGVRAGGSLGKAICANVPFARRDHFPVGIFRWSPGLIAGLPPRPLTARISATETPWRTAMRY